MNTFYRKKIIYIEDIVSMPDTELCCMAALLSQEFMVMEYWKCIVGKMETVRQVRVTQYVSVLCRCTTKYDMGYLQLKPIVF
jgi:hypothetical protein